MTGPSRAEEVLRIGREMWKDGDSSYDDEEFDPGLLGPRQNLDEVVSLVQSSIRRLAGEVARSHAALGLDAAGVETALKLYQLLAREDVDRAFERQRLAQSLYAPTPEQPGGAT